ncbi:transposase [Planctomicrobium sp. SH661]|uniref:transposase n=1 Tax=Planctomicrobium sp. SH661 TaxID=3448124 RepID=UPI003F5B0FB9
MALGKREESQQQEFWTPTANLSRGPGHVFYDKLNQVLAKAGFDKVLEDLCSPYYASTGRMSIPPGVYFRMLLVGYFEGIDSQRGIAWRCEDSLSLRRFLGIPMGKETPDHSSLTRIRDRLPLEIHQQVFQLVLSIIDEHGLMKLKATGVDSTLLEANAAMKTIVRKDSGEDWKEFLKRLMQEEGLIEEGETPSDDDLRKFDKARHQQGKKKVSNTDWESSSDPDSRIVKMKDGCTHLGYKAEHVIDLESEFILSATVCHGTASDASTFIESVVNAQQNVILAGSPEEIEEVAADQGYHKNETITQATQLGLRTYIPEPNSQYNRTWTDKPVEVQQAVLNNRQRMSRSKGKDLQRQRSEKVERSFAHVCETGGARRTWLRGLEKINKRYLIVAAARNLGLLMLKAFGIGKPRGLQGGIRAILALWGTCTLLWAALRNRLRSLQARTAHPMAFRDINWQLTPQRPRTPRKLQIMPTSTGC